MEISLIDSVGIAQTGGYPVEENYTYTAEGVGDYLSSLKPGGVLSVTVWNKLSPPRNVLRLLASVVEGLRQQGVLRPERRIFCFQLLLQTHRGCRRSTGAGRCRAGRRPAGPAR